MNYSKGKTQNLSGGHKMHEVVYQETTTNQSKYTFQNTSNDRMFFQYINNSLVMP
jgi:hypothetical protein